MGKEKKKKKAKEPGAQPKQGGLISYRKQIFLIAGLMMAIVMMATTFLLVFALLPSFVALFIDRSKRKMKAITVGAMNLAGATPFLLELWAQGNTFDASVSIVTEPGTIVIIYSAAAVGYFIDWSMTSFFSRFIVQRGKTRMKAIKKRQEELVERWGKEVTGDYVLDQFGFEILDAPPPKEKK